MKTRSTVSIISSVLIIFSVSLAMCGKSAEEPEKIDVEKNKAMVPDPALPYILLNIAKEDKSSNPIFPTPDDFQYRTFPTTSGNMGIAPAGGDTVRCFWFFNPARNLQNPAFPSWRFCGVDYDLQGQDQYGVSIYWSKATDGTSLKPGKTYSLNTLNNSLINTRGLVTYAHRKNNVTIKNLNTFDYALTKSWIKIESISEGKASGTFLFGFSCANAGGAGGSATDVTGRFNKIIIN